MGKVSSLQKAKIESLNLLPSGHTYSVKQWLFVAVKEAPKAAASSLTLNVAKSKAEARRGKGFRLDRFGLRLVSERERLEAVASSQR